MKLDLNGFALKAAKQTEFFVRKNSPTILTGAGIVGFIASNVLMARATVKAVDKLPQISANVKHVKGIETNEVDPANNYTEKQKVEDLVKVYARSSVQLGKIYAPSILVGSAAIVCVISAHGLMLKRQASLVAAYSALDAGFRAYRARVAEKFGEDAELDLYRHVRTIESVDEEGLACQIVDRDDPMPMPYARFFDSTSRNWTKTPDYNLMFLRSQQDFANDKLTSVGYLFLNEVYEALGLERSQIGQIVGWKKEKTGKNDGYVDFGLYSIGDDSSRAFVNGIEATVLLDFNVDGIIKI